MLGIKRNQQKEVGLKSDVIKYPDSVEEKVILDKINDLNKDESVSGILVQLPLPKHIDKQKLLRLFIHLKTLMDFIQKM